MDGPPGHHSLFCSDAPGIGTCRGIRKKVLIVDDEYLIRYAMQKLIEDEGYSAFTAECANDALHLFNERKPDIVILDIGLPDMNGLVLLKTIKEISPSVTVIMATGNPDAQGSVEAIKMGALAYLEKPVNIDALKHLMKSGNQGAVNIQ